MLLLKAKIRRLIPKKLRTTLKRALGLSSIDEVDLLHDLIRSSDVPRIMCDVGAHHGGSLEEFARSGWQVYAFEPDPANRLILEQFTRGWHNVIIDQRALSNKDQSDQPLFRSPLSSGISSLTAFHPTHSSAGRVDTLTLKTCCEQKGISEIGFLKIDTEGYDLFVLQGIDWDAMSPHVVLCEFEDRKTNSLGYDFHLMAQFLISKDYRVLVSEWHPIVRYGGPHDWRKFAIYPCALADPDSWGNIIGIRDTAMFERLCKLAGVDQNRRETSVHD